VLLATKNAWLRPLVARRRARFFGSVGSVAVARPEGRGKVVEWTGGDARLSEPNPNFFFPESN